MLTFVLVVGAGVAVAFVAAPVYLWLLTALRPWLDQFRPTEAQGQVFVLGPERHYQFGAATVIILTLAAAQTARVNLLDARPTTTQGQVFFQIG